MNTAGDFHKGELVWWNDPNRVDYPGLKLGERACQVVSGNLEKDTVLVNYFKDPTVLREEAVAVVSPRALRLRDSKGA